MVDGPAPLVVWGEGRRASKALIAYGRLPLKADPYLDEDTLNTSIFGIQNHQTGMNQKLDA